MNLVYDPRVVKFLDKLGNRDKSKIREYILLFEEHGFRLDTRYLKKIIKDVWEVRPGRVRLFLYVRNDRIIVVHANYKKSQKIVLKDLKLIEDRVKQYI